MNKRFVSAGVAVFIGVCVLQALYYPFMSSPEIPEPSWWQIGPLAGIGFAFGIPLFYLSNLLGFYGHNEELLIWFLATIYIFILYRTQYSFLRKKS
jgi:hypothetical protein